MTLHERSGWMCGLLGCAGAAIGWLYAPMRFHYAWLAALTTWWAVPLGSITLLLIHRLTGGQWGVVLSPALRAATATMPLVVLALVPVVFGFAIYPWAQPGGAALPNHLYLNAPFMTLRLAIDALLWLALSWLVVRSPATWIAAAGLPLLALSFTSAVIDLTLSLEPVFSSSIYGMLQGAAGVVLALSIAMLAAMRFAPFPALPGLARLLLALVALCGYLDFMQYLIVWESNLPGEALWYVRRTGHGWGVVFGALAVLHFLLPLLALMLPRVQRSRRAITVVAGLLVAMGVVRGWWTVLPETHGGLSWIDCSCVAAFAGLGSVWAMRAARRPPVLRHA